MSFNFRRKNQETREKTQTCHSELVLLRTVRKLESESKKIFKKDAELNSA